MSLPGYGARPNSTIGASPGRPPRTTGRGARRGAGAEVRRSLPPSQRGAPLRGRGGARGARGGRGGNRLTQPPPKVTVEALFDCEAENESELSFKKGDRIVILNKPHGEWWMGSIGGRTGLLPVNYVKEIAQSPVARHSSPLPSTRGGQINKAPVATPPMQNTRGGLRGVRVPSGSGATAVRGGWGGRGRVARGARGGRGVRVPSGSGRGVRVPSGNGRGVRVPSGNGRGAPSGGENNATQSALHAMQLINKTTDNTQQSTKKTPVAVCTALFDCNGDNSDELSFKAGDIINVLDKRFEEWWFGETLSGESGLFPSNYVKEKKMPALVPRSSSAPSTASTGRSGSGSIPPPVVQPPMPAGAGRGVSPNRNRSQQGSLMCIEKARALFDFNAQNPDELEFKEGDVIDVLSKKHPEWWLGAISGRQGIFPCSWVEPLSASIQRSGAGRGSVAAAISSQNNAKFQPLPAGTRTGPVPVLPPKRKESSPPRQNNMNQRQSMVLQRAASLASVLKAPSPHQFAHQAPNPTPATPTPTASTSTAAAAEPPQTVPKKPKRGIFKKLSDASSSLASSAKKPKKPKKSKAVVPGFDSEDMVLQDRLIRIVVSSDLSIVLALCDALEMREKDRVAMALVHAFEINGTTPHLVKMMIEKEVSDTDPQSSHASSLFRGNSMATKVLTAYSLMVARDYLRKTLKPLISSIAYSDNNWEIDPTKIDPRETLAENKQNLLAAAAMFLSKIIRSVDSFPYPTRLVCQHLAKVTSSKFPSSVHVVIGSFFFLRFICPAIISPVEFGVWTDKLPNEAKRPLILISKTLQCLSNGVTFGAKEAYMEPLNPFIEEHTPKVKQFFEQLADPPKDGYADQYSHTVLKRDPDMFAILYESLSSKFSSIKSTMTSQYSNHAQKANELEKFLNETAPAQASSSTGYTG